MKKKFTMLLAALFLVMGTAWAQTVAGIVGNPTTTLTDGKYVVVAMSDKGVGPCYYHAEGGGRHYRYDLNKTINPGDKVTIDYVWTIDETTEDGVQHITVTNFADDTKFFVKDNGTNQNFGGSEKASLKVEKKTISETDYIALTLDDANIGYIYVNAPGGNPNLSYWPGYSDEGACTKFTFYPVELDVAGENLPLERKSTFAVGDEMYIYSTCRVNGTSDWTGFFTNNNGTASLIKEKPAYLFTEDNNPIWVIASLETLQTSDETPKTYYKVTLKNKATDKYLGIGGLTTNAEVGDPQTFYISQWQNPVFAGDTESRKGVMPGTDVWSENVDGTALAPGNITANDPIWVVQAATGNCFNTNSRQYKGGENVAYPIVFYSVGNKEDIEQKYFDMIKEVNTTITSAESLFSTAGFTATPVALQVTQADAAGYIKCNNLDPTEGNDMNYLIDNNPSTYIHSNWHNKSSEKDYLEVYLGEGNGMSLFYFTEITRGDANTDYPSSVEILGSENGSSFEPITTVSGLPVGNSKSYTSPLIKSDSKYKYLRFVVTGSNYAADRPFFHMAEFDLYSVAINEKYVGRGTIFCALNEAVQNGEKAIADLNLSAMNSAKTAMDELIAEGSVTYPFTLTTDDENPVLYAIKSGRTNQDKGWWYTFDPTDQKIGLTQFTMANTQYWYFKEIVKNNKVYLQLYPAAGEGKAMSYNNTNNTAGNVIAKDVNNTENYKSTWLLEEVNGKYGLQTEGRENRLSNNGGVVENGVLTNNKMGMWNDSPSADAGSAMYFFEKPKYPFAVTTDDENPELYAIKSGRTNLDKGWWYTYDPNDQKIGLTQFTGADNQYWYFKEVASDKNAHGLQLYPAVGNGMVMSYENIENGRAKIVAKELGTEDWYSTWIFETTEGNAPYGLQTEDKKNRLSNNGGVVDNQGNLTDFKMGMWDASPSADAGSAMYLFAKPIYPFTPTIDDANPELYAIKSGRTDDNKEWWYTYVTAEGDDQYEIALSNTYTGDDTQMWYFKEVASDKNGHGLQLYPYLGEGKAISYTSTADQQGDIKAVALGTEGTNNIWIFETTNGNAPYGLQTEGKEIRLSNNGGVTNTMGLWNASPSLDTGSAMYIISSALDELNELAKLSIYTEKATAAIEQARICNNRAGIEEIVLNVKKSIDGQNVKLKLKATDVRVGKFLGYDVANGRVAAVLSSGDDVIWTLKANGDGTVKLYNWVHDKYLGAPGDPTSLVDEAGAAAFEIKVTADNTMALAIGDKQMLHIANHDNYKAINHYSLTDPASLWEVTPIDPIVVTRKEYDRFAEVASLAPTYLYALLGQYGLVKEAAKYTSNWKSEQEGSFEALLDGDYTTYFHSAYTNEAIAEEAAAHYIQAELEAPVSGFYFYMKKRLQNDANRPVAVTVYGCDTPDGNFEKIADVETTLSETDDYLSAKIECGKLYQYLRFEVNSTNTGTKFFTLSEFYLLPTMSFLVEPYREFKATSITSTDFSLYATAFKNAYLLETSSATQLFRLKNTASGRYMTIVEKDKADGIKIKGKMDASVGQAYYLLKTDSLNVFQIKSTEGYFMTAFNPWYYKASQSDKAQETAHGLEYIGEGQYRLHTWKGYAGPNNGASDEDSPLYSNHDLKNQNIAWELEPLTMTSVKYIYKYNGEEFNSETFENIIEGFAYPAPTVALPFGLVAAIPEGIKGAEAEIIEIDCDVDLPFEFAEDYNSIVKWYYLNIRDENPTYLYYDPSVEYIKAIKSSVPADEKDAYTWAFVGNPIDGFSIVNYKAGASMVLSAPKTPSKNQDAGQLARMVVAEGATGNKVWDFVTPTHEGAKAEAFYVQHPDDAAWALNRQTYQSMNVVCYWNKRDTGSDLQVVERNDYKDLTDLITAAESMKVVTNGVGTFTEVTVSVFNEKLSEAKGLSESSDFSTIIEATVALQKAIENLETIQPEEETFYTIQNSYSKVYMNVSGDTGMKTTDSAGIGELFQFVPAADGKFYMYNIERGTYLSTAKAHNGGQNQAGAVEQTSAVAVTITNLGAENHVSIVPEGGATLHHDANYSTVVAWDGGLNSRSSWQIVEVPTHTDLTRSVTVNQYGYSTLYLNYPVVVPEIEGEGNGVFVASLVDGDILHMRRVNAGSTISAKTGVVVKANANSSCEFKYSTEVGDTESLFRGTLLNEKITPDENTICYMLGKAVGTEEIGFFPVRLRDDNGNLVEEGGTYFQNSANKIYLPVSKGQNAPSLSFRFGTSEVEHVDVAQETEMRIYDLMGRRVEKMDKGIYIVNGKKVVIK